jgi:hypothetical protein
LEYAQRVNLLYRALFLAATAPALAACSDADVPPATLANPCDSPAAFDVGDPTGHADPLGASAAGQARAGRITDLSAIPQPAHGRQRISDGDFLLINDKIAVVIEDSGLSDGYGRFGGEILAIDQVGEDGRPRGVSLYGETLLTLSLEMVNATSVTVLKDGSDGGEAVVRVLGVLEGIPFLQGPLKLLLPREYGLQAALDYVLAPGEEKVTLRVGVINETPDPIDFGVERSDSDELYGFFQHNHSNLVTPEHGYSTPKGFVEWAGFDAGPWSFAWRAADGPIEYGLEQSGFTLFFGAGFIADGCSTYMNNRVEIIAGGPEYDGLRAAVRRASGEPAWRTVTGTVTDQDGAPLADAWVHELSAKGDYLSRTRTGPDGAFTMHAPDEPVTLVPQKHGYPAHAGTPIEADQASAALALAAHGLLRVVATDAGSGVPLPVRVQVIPAVPVAPTPEVFGVPDEVNGRLYQEFVMTGEATLTVPPGEHRVIVSRGYEWELLDTTVTVPAGGTTTVPAPLVHSVDTTGVMCADFHIHSSFSADSSDPVLHKVKGALADGLDIPVSSEHEWVTDFQPIIEQLGLTQWAFGVPSQELTTFVWGHFGVLPITPRPTAVNAGAVEWIGLQPPEVFEHVHALPENPVLIVNHPSGSSFGSYFTAAKFQRDTGIGEPGLWSDNFEAVEVFNDSDFEENRGESVADWFALLNHGHRMVAVGSSDSHHLRTSPVGYPRTCLSFGHDDPKQLTANAVRDAVADGSATVSGGLFMVVEGPGGERPGDSVSMAGATGLFRVTVQAPSWIDATELEVIVGGETTHVEPLMPLGPGPGKRFVNEVMVSMPANATASWVVFHAKGETDLSPLHPGRRPFAASNPIYLAP